MDGADFDAASIAVLDGYIARKRKIITVFGSFLDPIADKFLVVSSILMLQALGAFDFVVIVLVLREFYITSLDSGRRTWRKNSCGNYGKVENAAQMIGIPMLWR